MKSVAAGDREADRGDRVRSAPVGAEQDQRHDDRHEQDADLGDAEQDGDGAPGSCDHGAACSDRGDRRCFAGEERANLVGGRQAAAPRARGPPPRFGVDLTHRFLDRRGSPEG